MDEEKLRISLESNEDVPDEAWEQYADYMAYGDWEPGKPYDLDIEVELETTSIRLPVPLPLYRRIRETGEDVTVFMLRAAQHELENLDPH